MNYCRECDRSCTHSSGLCAACLLANHGTPYTYDYNENKAWHDARNAREKKESNHVLTVEALQDRA